MPIQVQGPDGATIEFPDGTPQATMEAALQAHYGKPKATQPARVSTSEGESALHALGRGARDVMVGAAGIPDILVKPLAEGVNALGISGLPRQGGFVDLANTAADAMRLPKPENATQRVESDVGRALSGTAVTLGAGSALPAASRLGQFLTAQPKLQALSSATGAASSSIARENDFGEGTQTLAGLVGGLAPGGIVSGLSGTLRGLVRGREAGRQVMENNIRDFRAVGAQPSAGQAAGNFRMQGVESLLSGAPTSSGVMTRAAERQADAIGRGLQDKADAFFPNASAERAGRAVEKGAQQFGADVKATRDGLYRAADAHIPATTPMPLVATRATLYRLTQSIPGAAATSAKLVNPEIASLAKRIQDDLIASKAVQRGGVLTHTGEASLPYAAVQSIRTKIGQELSDFSLATDRPTAQYKALYAALSQDMENAAARQGPEAVAAMRRANSYFKASADRLETLDRVVDKVGGPEKVYSAVMSGTKDGGSTLHAVMQSLPKDGQKALTAAVIKRMGLATAGNQNAAGDVFSAQTFLTNWGNVSKEAKRALFDRHGPQFAADMDRIARVAENIRTGSKVFANPSGTANKAALLTYGGSLAGSVATGQVGVLGALVGGGVTANVTARALTNPKVVNWLAKTTTMPAGSFASQLSMLAQLGKTDPDAQALYDAIKRGK